MNILSHFFNSNIINSHFSDFSNLHESLSFPLNLSSDIHNYSNYIAALASASKSLILSLLVSHLEAIDLSFRNSNSRKSRYYVKVTRSRTLITPFGIITYTRTIYSFKDGSKGTYCHLDSLLGIPKYDRYDPCVKAMMVEYYADSNSMIKVGKILGERIYSAFSLDYIRKEFCIPRQTIFNTLKKMPVIDSPLSSREVTPPHLYIMADEKFIPLQSHKEVDGELVAEKQMTKAAVIFEDIEDIGVSKPRHKLVNKHILLSKDDNFWEYVYDKVNDLYDLDKIKEVIILGDGALWIRKGIEYFKSATCKSNFHLDKFHFQQSLTRISTEKEIRNSLIETIIEDKDRNTFKKMINGFIEVNPDKEETLLQQETYILNNWKYIQNSYQDGAMSCSMESAISHYIVSSFTSVPKGYKRDNLETYLRNRSHYLNGFDVQQLYIDSLQFEADENNQVILKDPIDLSFFNPRYEYAHSAQSRYIDRRINYSLKRIN